MDAEMKKVEAFASQLPELSDEPITLLLLRGVWHRDARNEFDEALPFYGRQAVGLSPEVERATSKNLMARLPARFGSADCHRPTRHRPARILRKLLQS